MASVAGQGTVQEAIAAKVDALVLDAESAWQRLQWLLPAFRAVVAHTPSEPGGTSGTAGLSRLSIATLRIEKADIDGVLQFEDRLGELPGIHDIALYGWESGAVTLMLARWQLPMDPGRTEDAEPGGPAV